MISVDALQLSDVVIPTLRGRGRGRDSQERNQQLPSTGLAKVSAPSRVIEEQSDVKSTKEQEGSSVV